MTGSPGWRCVSCGAPQVRVTASSVGCGACGRAYTRQDGIWASDVAPAANRFDAAAAGRLAALDGADHFWVRHRQRLLARLLDRLDTRGTLAELGCGCGGMLPAWDARFETVVAVDAHRELLARARERSAAATLVQADVCATPLGEAQFNLVAAFDVIEHVDPDALLAEARRLARPGGRLLLAAPAFPMLWSEMDERAGHRCRYDARQLRGELERNGWRWDGHTYFQCLLFPLVYASRRMGGGTLPLERKPGRFVDRALGLVNRLEVAVSGRMALPFGSSIIAWGTRL